MTAPVDRIPLLLPMRTLLLFAAAAWLGPFVAVAETPAGFVAQLTPEERALLRVDEMSPVQLAALEKAARRFAGGPGETPAPDLAAPPAAANEAALAAVLAETQAKLEKTEGELAAAKASLQQQPRAEKVSMLQRAKVLLTPGTEIEYETVESRLVDEFRGWKVGTLFNLENGQVWRVTNGNYWSPREGPGKAVRVVPGALGSFFIEIEGVRQSPRVEFIR